MALAPPPQLTQQQQPGASPQDEITQFFRSLLNRDPTPEEIQQFSSADKSTWGQLIKTQLSPSEQQFGTWANQPTPTPTPTPTAGPTSDPTQGGLLAPFSEQFNAPAPIDNGGPQGLSWLPPQPTVTGAPTPNLPSWNTPTPFTAAPFQAPTVADAMADPGLKTGNANIQNWAAAKGTLNDSSTANALSDYAVHNYDSVFNRDLSAYQTNFGNSLQGYLTNYQTQNVDPYTHAYQAALDMNAPATSTWNAQNAANSLGYSTTAAGAQRQTEDNYSNAYNKWLADWQMFMDQRDSTFNKQFQVATA